MSPVFHLRLAFGIACALLAPAVAAADISVFSSESCRAALEALRATYEKSSGDRLRIVYAPDNALQARVAAGETFDVVLLPAMLIAALERSRRTAAPATAIARAGMGLVVRAGSAHPAVTNAAQLRELLLQARSIAVARESRGGERFLLLLENLGIAEEVAPRLVDSRGTGTTPANLVATGRADLGMQLLPEIAANPGVELLAAWPPEVQFYEVLSGAPARNARASFAAQAFLRFLASPASAGAFRTSGWARD